LKELVAGPEAGKGITMNTKKGRSPKAPSFKRKKIISAGSDQALDRAIALPAAVMPRRERPSRAMVAPPSGTFVGVPGVPFNPAWEVS
jgi:hypothetical protein